ncbi:hypothetical protein K440DRAFT_640476 [Wilcoxina mikolae CBS 423.85]|nr:hypothetical protein K440DRAFT_640476 [Wilcoxina mikolae CBS 423.85]
MVRILMFTIHGHELVSLETLLQLEPEDFKLSGLYTNLFKGIPEEDYERSFMVLSWIVFALRPLTAQQLIAAVAVNSGARTMLQVHCPHDQQTEDLKKKLGALIKIDEDGVYLVHHTLREFLIEHGNELGSGLAPPCTLSQTSHDFSAYAARHWPDHIRLGGSDKEPELVRCTVEFLSSDVHVRRWSGLYERLNSPLSQMVPDHEVEPWDSPLNIASHLGLSEVVVELLHQNQVANTTTTLSDLVIALKIAATDGHAETVQAILNLGEGDVLGENRMKLVREDTAR